MKKTKHTAIGAFVVGAIALTVLAIMLFGSGEFFETNITYTLCFDKSVKGLAKGAPVMFRGIKIGEVTDVKLSFDNDSTPQELQSEHVVAWPIVVTIKLFPYSVAFEENRNASWIEKMARKFYPQSARDTMETWLQKMVIQKGLRAQLQSQNFLTGLLYIELDLFQNEKTTPDIEQLMQQHIIPTRISAIERLYLSLNQNNFTTQLNHFFDVLNAAGKLFTDGKAEKLIGNLTSASEKVDGALTNINQIAEDLHNANLKLILKHTVNIFASLEKSAQNLEQVLQTLNHPRTTVLLEETANSAIAIKDLTQKLDQKLPGLIDNANESLTQIRVSTKQLTPKVDTALDNANQLMGTLDQTVKETKEPLLTTIQQLNQIIAQLNQAATEGSRVLAQARKTMSPDAPLVQNLTQAIKDAQQAARAVKQLADMLNDSPEAVLRGRP